LGLVAGGAGAAGVPADGRSSSEKTTPAARLQGAVGGSAVVHTDDLAWGHSRFGWAGLLVDGVLMPGKDVNWRAAGLRRHQRTWHGSGQIGPARW
jgi:hypothetical protein